MDIYKTSILLIIFISLNSASTLIEYRFSSNFGKVFYDYSENSNSAVNGESLLSPSSPVISTDRGAYFPLGSSKVKIPPNELVSSFSMPSQFSISIWLLIEDYSFYCFFCRSESSLFYIARYLASSNIAIYLSDPNNAGSEHHSPINTFQNGIIYSGQWKFLLIDLATSVSITIDTEVQVIYTIHSPFNLNQLESCLIGEVYGQTSLIGFVWSFFLYNSPTPLSSLISGPSSNCIISGCSPCSNSIIINSTSWCLPVPDSDLKNSLVSTCANCLSCYSGSCLSCSICTSSSCQYTGSEVLCKCNSAALATQTTCLCPSQQFYDGRNCLSCRQDCATCSDSLTCDSCIAFNAVPTAGGCICLFGYYNKTALVNSDSCLSCGDKCKICGKNGGCLECKMLGALGAMDCQCPDGKFNNGNVLCQNCHPECSKCESFGPCKSCIAENATPADIGCKCLPYFGGLKPLILPGSCVACNFTCKTCDQKDKCLTCKDSNSVVDDIGCKCKDGYYLDETCQPCFSDCKHCNKTHCITCWDQLAQVNQTSCFCPTSTYLVSANPTSCANCRSDCKTCSDGLTCDECLVVGAVKQRFGCACENGYYSDSYDCVKCLNWDETSKHCNFCVHGEYFDGKNCVSCPKLCTDCDINGCSMCVDNAEIVENRCVCKGKYEGISKCEIKQFLLNVTANKENNLLLIFSLDLNQKLTDDNISITIENVSFSFSVISYSLMFYVVDMTYYSELNSSLQGVLKIKQKILSEFNTSLENNTYFFDLHSSTAHSSQIETNNTFKSLGSNSVYAALSITIFLSIFNFSFISFWSFLNVMQVLIYIRLINFNLPQKFDLVLMSLRETTHVFDTFNYLIDTKNMPKLTGRFYTFGFRTSLFFLNCGNWISILASLIAHDLALLILYLILEKLRFFNIIFIKSSLLKLRLNFRYNAYIRYSIQSYLDIGVSALVNLIFYQKDTIPEMCGLIFSAFFSLLVFLVPLFSIIFMKKHREDIERNNSAILNRYSSLFYEITSDSSLLASNFYFIFFLKRLLFIIVIFSLQNYPLIQLLLSMVLNISFTLYLYYIKPYSEKLISYSNILTEFAISLIYFLLILIYILDKYINIDLVDQILISLIYVIFVCQSVPPFLIFFNNIKMKVMQFFNKQKIHPEVPITSVTDITQQIESSVKPISNKVIDISNNLT